MFAPRPADIPAWADLTPEVQSYEARMMELYAAMIANLDDNVGRLLKAVDESGELGNTVIVFMSDNGADGVVRYAKVRALDEFVARFDKRLDSLGRRGSYPLYHSGWALAGETPLRRYKGYPYEGGVRSPAIVVAPGGRCARAPFGCANER